MRRASLLLLLLAGAPACVDPGHTDGGPVPSLSDDDVREACGDYATADEVEGEAIVSGNCRLQSRRQVELLNSFEVTQVRGTLEIVLAPEELDDLTLEHLASARQLRVGPGANVVAVRLPMLETLEGLTVRLNERLTTFSAPSLREVTSAFVFSENPVFPSCDAEALLAQLTAPPDELLVEANCNPCCSGG